MKYLKLVSMPAFILIAIGSLSCVESQGIHNEGDLLSVEPDVEVIQKLINHWNFYNEGDLENFMNGWADDAVFIPGGGPQAIGRDAIRSVFEPAFLYNKSNLQVEFDDVSITDGYAIYRGEWLQKMTPKGGSDTMEMLNNTLGIYKKEEDGAWKLWRAMWAGRPPIGLGDLP